MNFRYVVPFLRVIAMIVLAGFIAIEVRTYVLPRGLSIPPKVYGIATLVFIWFVASRSVKRVIDMLKVDAHARQMEAPTTYRQITREDYLGQPHMFPRRIGYLMAIFDVILFSLPYLTATPDRAIVRGMYFLCFGAGFMVAIMAIYVFRYRVTIRSDRIVIRAFRTCEIPFIDVAKIDVITTKNIPPIGPRGVVSLTDGKTLRFNGMLTGFNELIDALTRETRKQV